MPRLGFSDSLPVRDRPPSQYIATQPPRRGSLGGDERLVVARAAAHREHAARRVDPLHGGLLNSCDLAMNRTLRRMNAPVKKWSMNEKWLGARITGPDGGTFWLAIERARKNVYA